MTASEIRELIKQELPRLVKEDPEIHALILHLSRKEFAPKQQTEDRFDRILAQLERDRESGGSGSLDRNLPDVSGFLQVKLPVEVTAN